MKVPLAFHGGEWKEIDNWIEENVGLTYLLASLIYVNIFGWFLVVILFVIHS